MHVCRGPPPPFALDVVVVVVVDDDVVFAVRRNGVVEFSRSRIVDVVAGEPEVECLDREPEDERCFGSVAAKNESCSSVELVAVLRLTTAAPSRFSAVAATISLPVVRSAAATAAAQLNFRLPIDVGFDEPPIFLPVVCLTSSAASMRSKF